MLLWECFRGQYVRWDGQRCLYLEWIQHLPLSPSLCTVYLRKFVFVAPFLPPNETVCPFLFYFWLPDLVLLLLALRPFWPFLGADDVLMAVVFLAMGVPVRRMLFGSVPLPLTFFKIAVFNLSSNNWIWHYMSFVFLSVVSSTSPWRIGCGAGCSRLRTVAKREAVSLTRTGAMAALILFSSLFLLHFS